MEIEVQSHALPDGTALFVWVLKKENKVIAYSTPSATAELALEEAVIFGTYMNSDTFKVGPIKPFTPPPPPVKPHLRLVKTDPDET